MKAAGLLSLDLPPGFTVPVSGKAPEDEDPLEEGDRPEFVQDFVGAEGDPILPCGAGEENR